MGRRLTAWKLCENTLGKDLTDRLRHGEPIQISASNGEIYEIDPVRGRLKCITRQEEYCVHPEDTMRYPFGDMVVLWWTFLHHDPDKIEQAVGPESEGHRTPIRTIMRNPRRIPSNLTDFRSALRYGLENPGQALGFLPPAFRDTMNSLLADILQVYVNGDIQISWR